MVAGSKLLAHGFHLLGVKRLRSYSGMQKREDGRSAGVLSRRWEAVAHFPAAPTLSLPTSTLRANQPDWCPEFVLLYP